MRVLRVAAIGAVCVSGLLAAQTTATPPPQEVRHIARVSTAVMQGQILQKVQPVYPQSAKENGIQGTVILHAIIGTDGHVERLEAISGPPELATAALDAVKQWTYKPYLLNGEPTEVDTTVVVNFNLQP